MKKLFTLVALLAMFLGANAQGGKWVEVYSIDYSTYNEFPFYVMGYAPSFDGTAMVDAPTTQQLWRGNESDFPGEEACSGTVTIAGTDFYVQEKGSDLWRQYFMADGIGTKLDGKYKVVAQVRATNTVSVKINMGWGWGNGEQASTTVSIPGATEFQEVEWEYTGINGTSCNLVAQPGTIAETIEWQSLKVYEWQKEGTRPKVWLEDIENGDAETPWGDLANTKFDDQENNFKVCAWSKERMVNPNDKGGWDPFPATIEVDPDNDANHVFVCHGKAAVTEGDAAAWDNQFWIQSKHAWKAGTTLKIKFRYKASKEIETETQIHKQNPSDYLIWHAIGNITFKEEWQTFEKDMVMGDDMNGGWSIAFNLNAKDKDAVDFYFDDLSWQYLKLDEGYFVSGINATTTTSYDNLDNAIQFTVDDESGYLLATVGEKGNANSYVDQVMISTTRGDDQAFKGATLKPTSKIKSSSYGSQDEIWLEYVASNNAKLDLPGLGVWKIYIDLEYNSMAFEMLEGTEYAEKEPVEIVTNPSVLVVNALERQPTATEQPADPEAGIEAGTGQPWDNQFFIKDNRVLKTDEVTVIEFDYVASQEAKSTTQCHALPGEYRGGGMGEVNFTTEEQHFIGEFKVPSHEKADIQTMVFNLAEIKDACQYTFKNIKWYLKSDQEGMTDENLIDAEGTANFSWIVVGGTGIENVTKNVKSSNVTYNLAGQRVSKDFKGIVIKNGQKFMNK